MTSGRVSVWRLVSLALAAAGALWAYQQGPGGLRDLATLYFGTPHERYAAGLRLAGGNGDAREWLDSAERSLASPVVVQLPVDRRIAARQDTPEASAFVVRVKRGQRFVATADPDSAKPRAPFVDVFVRDDGRLRHLANAAEGTAGVDIEIPADSEVIVRVQPEMSQGGAMTVSLRTEPTLQIPVAGATARNVQSFFGAARDGGRRAHHGVDIFAARGTPVRAAAAGLVTSVGPNGLGGNTIWITRPARGESHYYAHLDRQLVSAGTYVQKGDVIGLVGNTGNARSTAPHLHFGIYTASGPVDPLPYISVQSVNGPRRRRG